MSDEPKPEFNLHLTPESLKNNATFQEAWRTAKPFMQDLMLYLQRRKAKELTDEKEELGRQVIVINDIMEIFDECSGGDIKGQKQKQVRKPLNNR